MEDNAIVLPPVLYKVSFTYILEISRGFVQIFLETTGRKWTASVNSWVDAQTLYLGILENRAVQPRQKPGLLLAYSGLRRNRIMKGMLISPARMSAMG